jgi:osmoprotectant transport system substrate-binding protein
MYPEYTGNVGWWFDEAGAEVWKDLQRGYERAKELDEATYNITWLKPVPITNDWAIAIPRDFAEAESLVTLDDFASYVNEGGYVKLIGSEEFVSSEAALPAFQEAYGFSLTEDQLITVASGDTTQTEKAASEGMDEVNVSMAYSTDGGISAYGLVVLIDNRGVNPVYAPAPRVREEVLEQYPEIASILNPVFESLDLETLQSLNEKTAVEGQSPADVARDYLTSQGFLK